jgi:uncharacterized coiled-coil DUF342 family protein
MKPKANGKSKGVSTDFLKEVSDKLNIINHLSKDSGVEIPNELEETLKEMSISSSKREAKLESLNASAREDASILNSSVESSSVKKIKQSSQNMFKALQDQLQLFKSANKQSRNDAIRAEKELKVYQSELNEMKGSVIEIIDEAQGTKEQIVKMKEKLDNDEEKYEEYDMSACKVPSDSSNLLLEQIKELHQEIYLIQSRIERSEQDLKQKEMENRELKEVIERLNDSFERFGNETEDGSGNCQNCEVV